MPPEPTQPDDQPVTNPAQPGAVFNPAAAQVSASSPEPAVPTPVPAQEPAVPVVEPTPLPPAEPAPPPAPIVDPPLPPEPAPERPDVQEVSADDAPLLTWQASEYLHHDKRVTWYLAFFAVVAILIAVAAVTHQWLTIGVFVVMAGALVVYANKAPRVLNYGLGDNGITIENKLFPYDSFRSFGVIQDVAWHMIDLEPLRRFMPRLSIMFEDANRDQIVAILSEHIQRQDRQPDMVERVARYLRF